MTELDTKIAAAYASHGEQEKVNKVYTAFFRSDLWLPIQPLENAEEPFIPLHYTEGDHHFIPVFDTYEKFSTWAGEKMPLAYAELTGFELLRGVGEHIYLCLNIGTDFYKEFSPDEITRLKVMVLKVDSFKKSHKK